MDVGDTTGEAVGLAVGVAEGVFVAPGEVGDGVEGAAVGPYVGSEVVEQTPTTTIVEMIMRMGAMKDQNQTPMAINKHTQGAACNTSNTNQLLAWSLVQR